MHRKSENLRTIINNYIRRGYNSKSYWNIIRQLRQNKAKDLYALKNDKRVRLFSESEIKNYTH